MQTLEIFRKLISFPVLGGESNLEIIRYIEGYLSSLGVDYSLVPNDDDTKTSLHCRIGPEVSGGVILSGHTDVVPVEGQPWDTDPFTLVERNGKLYARGSCDMKGYLACCLAAVPAMLQARLSRPIYLAFSYDEEVGCLAGPALVEDIVQTYDERPQYVIVGEPTEMKTVVGHKGIGVLETTVKGSQGHSSRIRQEVSAVHVSARLITWLEDYMNTLIASGHLDERFNPPHSSLHVGMIEGGIAPNIVADHCHFTVDVRTIPMDKILQIYEDYHTYARELLDDLKKIQPVADIQITEWHPIVPPLDTPSDAALTGLVQKLTGMAEIETVSFAAEAGQFAEAGFEAVMCGPGSISQAHRANEFIEIDQLEKGQQFILDLIDHLETKES